jgi:methylmalonyl-CoA mutase cobalamin-binding domain/chain
MNNYENKIEKIRKNYLDALLNKDRKRALSVIDDATNVNSSVDFKDIYLEVFQKTQHEIGDLWMTGKISVAQEHFCTAVTQSAMAQLYTHIFKTDKCGKTFLAFCVSEELHDLGLRMVTDMMEMAGWDTIYLGANVPSNHIEEAIIDCKVDILGISISIAKHLHTAKLLIKNIRETKELSHVRIIVGGYAINKVPTLWKKIGADAYAENAVAAISTATQLIG